MFSVLVFPRNHVWALLLQGFLPFFHAASLVLPCAQPDKIVAA